MTVAYFEIPSTQKYNTVAVFSLCLQRCFINMFKGDSLKTNRNFVVSTHIYRFLLAVFILYVKFTTIYYIHIYRRPYLKKKFPSTLSNVKYFCKEVRNFLFQTYRPMLQTKLLLV